MSQKRCILQYMHSVINTDGSVDFCCNSLDYKEKPVHLHDRNLEDILNSPKHKKTRLDIEKGLLPEVCSLCWKDEDLGIRSYRQKMNDYYSKYNYLYDQLEEDGSISSKVKYLDLRLNNTCNLKCIMCSSQFSTSWIPEEKKLLEVVEDENTKEQLRYKIESYESEKYKWSKDLEHIDGLMDLVDEVERIHFVGGEPLLAKPHIPFLKALIKKGINKNVMLSYNTNASYIDDTIIELWSHFKSVKVMLSIDGIGEQLEYIRYPMKWETLVDKFNLIENCPHDNIFCAIHLTLNALNAPYLKDIIDWKLNCNYKKLHFHPESGEYLFTMMPLVYPEQLSIQVLPKNIKDKIIYDLEEYSKTVKAEHKQAVNTIKNTTIKYINDKDQNNLWSQFVDYCNALDKTRALDFRKTFPIFKDL